jgi:hypothetical protein
MPVSGGLIRCGRCGKTYTNPFTHVCVGRIGAKPKGKTRLAPKVKVTAKCGSCGKPVTNPLTHTCTVKTDFKKRKKAAGAKPKHPEPEVCEDGPDCQVYGCRMFWRGYELGRGAGFEDGYRTGHAEGYAKGHNDGHAEGYAEGYAAGAASGGDS